MNQRFRRLSLFTTFFHDKYVADVYFCLWFPIINHISIGCFVKILKFKILLRVPVFLYTAHPRNPARTHRYGYETPAGRNSRTRVLVRPKLVHSNFDQGVTVQSNTYWYNYLLTDTQMSEVIIINWMTMLQQYITFCLYSLEILENSLARVSP